MKNLRFTICNWQWKAAALALFTFTFIFTSEAGEDALKYDIQSGSVTNTGTGGMPVDFIFPGGLSIGTGINPPAALGSSTSGQLTVGGSNQVLTISPQEIGSYTTNGFSPASSGTTLSANSQSIFALPAQQTSNIQIVLENGNPLYTGTNIITERASIEYPVNSGTFYPVYFNGVRDVTLQHGALAVSSPTGVTLPASTSGSTALFYGVRIYVTVSGTGMTWPLGFISNNVTAWSVTHNYLTTGSFGGAGSIGGWYVEGGTDMTTSGTTQAAGLAYSLGPLAVLGTSGQSNDAVGILGDSIAIGIDSTHAYNYGLSYLTSALQNAGIPTINLAYAGNSLAEEVSNSIQQQNINLLANSVKSVIIEDGIDDTSSGTLSVMEADLVSLANQLSAKGVKVYATTLTPYASSTDNFASGTGQTAINKTVRNGYNDWLRTIPAPLTGVFDVGLAVESGSDTDLWKTTGTANTYTPDGLHPSRPGSWLLQQAFMVNTLNKPHAVSTSGSYITVSPSSTIAVIDGTAQGTIATGTINLGGVQSGTYAVAGASVGDIVLKLGWVTVPPTDLPEPSSYVLGTGTVVVPFTSTGTSAFTETGTFNIRVMHQ